MYNFLLTVHIRLDSHRATLHGVLISPSHHLLVHLYGLAQLEAVGARLEHGVVGDGVGAQRGPAVPHRAQQVQRLRRTEGAKGQGKRLGKGMQYAGAESY